jgi:hypothetical protein
MGMLAWRGFALRIADITKDIQSSKRLPNTAMENS